MAGLSELDSFVRKFVLLWKSGCDAKLSVETEAGNAFVNLSVGLGKAALPGHVDVGHRGGSPARQRRSERRAAERKAKEAEKATEDIKDEQMAEESIVNVTGIVTQNELERKVTTSLIPQVDGTAEQAAQFLVMVEASEECCNDDVLEAFEENFYGHCKDKNVVKTDSLAYFSINEANKGLIKVQESYRIDVKDHEIPTDIIENWKVPYEFDDLAFKNAVYGVIKVKIKDVQRVR